MSCAGCAHAQSHRWYPWLGRCRLGDFKALRMLADPIHCTRRAQE